MKNYNLMSKPFHQRILKEAQLVDTLDSLMKQVSHPQQLTDLSEEEIQRIVGNASSTTKQLRPALQLARLLGVPQWQQRFTVRLPRDVVQYCRENIDFRSDQQTLLIGLNTKNMITWQKYIDTEVMAHIPACQRFIFRELILRNAASGIIVQIVKNDDLTPTPDQITVAKTVAEAGDVCGIPILDMIYLTASEFLSFKEKGWL